MIRANRYPFIYGRIDRLRDERPKYYASRFRIYIMVTDTDARTALTKLICSDHTLAVEQCRRSAISIQRKSRVCLFCKCQGVVEDEAHILLHCPSSPQLAALRQAFLQAASASDRNFCRTLGVLSDSQALPWLLSDSNVHEHLGKFVVGIFDILDGTPMLRVTNQLQFDCLPHAPLADGA